MDNKGKIIIGLMVLIFVSISAVSANENTTDIVTIDGDSYDDDQTDDLDLDEIEPQKVKITAKDFTSYYDSDKVVTVQVKDYDGNAVKDVGVKIKYYSKNVDYGFTDSKGKCYFDVYENVGSHKATISLDDPYYTANPIKINVKVTKAPVKLKAFKITSKTNKYATLKVTVKDKWNLEVNQGTVKFKINGKSYSVKVKNGVATKKIKLTKAKTYSYKATFSAKNYKSKTASSKVIVKKAPKTYSYKKGKYSFRVSQSQQNKIQYVKNHKHSKSLSTYADFKVKTGKYYNGLPVYAVVTTWSGISNGQYLNYPQVQFVVMYGKETWDWDYLTAHYRL